MKTITSSLSFTKSIGLILGLALGVGLFTAFSNDPANASNAAVEPGAEKIEWLTFEEAMKRNEKEPRKIMIDLYTDWCGWCKKMDASTFSNQEISKHLNEKWYAVKFDAEQKEPVMYKDKEYNFVASGRRGYNELAHTLTKGRLSYPTIVYLDEKADVIQAIPGFKDAHMQDKILKFYGEDHFKQNSWVEFQTAYKSTIPKTR